MLLNDQEKTTLSDDDKSKNNSGGFCHSGHASSSNRNNPCCSQGDENSAGSSGQDPEDEENSEPRSFQEELRIEDLSRCIYFKDSKLFAAAGPGMPLLQVNTDGTFVALSPDKPYRPEVDEEVVVSTDEHGRLIDALGQIRKLTGMKYNGRQLYYVEKRHPEKDQHLAAWFDDEWNPHYLYLGETILSAQMVLKIRDRMIDGELNSFQEIKSD